ncbi:MAG TPA: four helix bundle protein [Terriglobales bacterium]|jgi:four helix bundle protein|nr:four helix bundle protein [Terriglobales bacterium]
MSVQSYRDLVAWKKAIALAKTIYRATEQFPRAETYGLTAQLRRAAVSIPSNIAEGQGRHSTGEFVQFLGTARGSLFEVETQVVLARDFGFLSVEAADQVLAETTELARVLQGLIASLTKPHPMRA